MPLEEIFSSISELRKKLFYIASVFGIGAIISFMYMGELIKKIEYDMFWRSDLQFKPDAAGRLIDISHNLTSISEKLASNNSIIAQELAGLSGEIMNISTNLNLNAPNIVYLTPMEVLMLEFKMSIIFGALLASPLIIFYAYKGFKGRLENIIPLKRSRIFSIMVIAILLFLTGAGYAYYFMLPLFLGYLYQDAASLGINANFSVYEFIYFIVMTTVIIGAAFELPLVLTVLVRSGVTSRQTLGHYRKHAYILLLIIAAWITPGPDVISQIMITLPFIVLYETSLLLMRLTGR